MIIPVWVFWTLVGCSIFQSIVLGFRSYKDVKRINREIQKLECEEWFKEFAKKCEK